MESKKKVICSIALASMISGQVMDVIDDGNKVEAAGAEGFLYGEGNTTSFTGGAGIKVTSSTDVWDCNECAGSGGDFQCHDQCQRKNIIISLDDTTSIKKINVDDMEVKKGANIEGGTKTDTLNVSSNAQVDGTMNVNGKTTMNGDAETKGNSTIDGNNTIGKNLTVSGDSSMNGNATIGKNLTVSGDSTTNGNTEVKGNSIIDGDSTVGKNLTVSGDSSMNGNATIGKNLTVSGTSTVNGDSRVDGNSSVGKSFTVTDDATIGKSLTVNGGTMIGKTLTVGENATFKKDVGVKGDIYSSGSVSANSFKVGGKTYIDSDGLNANGKKIRNVGDGEVSEDSKDAVNGGQLYAMKQELGEKLDSTAGGLDARKLNTDMSNLSESGMNTIKALAKEANEGEIQDIYNNIDAMSKYIAFGDSEQAALTGAMAASTKDAAFGQNSQAIGGNSTALGYNATVTGARSIAIGESNVSGTESVAMGVGNDVSGHHSIAIGDPNNVATDYSAAYGDNNEVGTGNAATIDPNQIKGNIVIGNVSTVEKGATGAFIIGNGSTISADTANSMALGSNAMVSKSNSVAIGNGSVADEENTISVGSKGNERRVTNVAAGRVSATSTDAINGSQLYSIGDEITSRINQSNHSMKSEIKSVAAGSAAMANLHPMEFNPTDRVSLAVSVGGYKDTTATAVGVFYRPDRKSLVSLSGTIGGNDNLVGLGYSQRIGHGKDEPYTESELQSKLDDLQEKYDKLQQEKEDMARDNEDMEQKYTEVQGKYELLSEKYDAMQSQMNDILTKLQQK